MRDNSIASPMKNLKRKEPAEKKIKAWAIVCPNCKPFCHHDDTYNIYRTRKEALGAILWEDGLPNCTYDTIRPILITFPPKSHKPKASKK